MSLRAGRIAVALTLALLAALPRTLRAEEAPPEIAIDPPPPAPPAPPPAPAPAPVPAPTLTPAPAEPSRPHVSVRFNPLNLLIGRVSGDVEVWPIRQVSIVATPWRVASYEQSAQTGDKGGVTDATLQLTGLEVGVRYWPVYKSVGRATFAAFLGLDGGGTWGTLDKTSSGAPYGGPYAPSSSAAIHQFVVAAEAGAALYFAPFMVQAGLGAQWTQSQGTDPSGPVFWDCSWVCPDNMHFYYGNGFLPRFLFSAGLAL